MKLRKENKELKEEHSKLKMAYESLKQHIQEITGYAKITEAIEAIKAKFSHTQEHKREEKPNSWQQLKEDTAEAKKELSQKEWLMQIADDIQREKEQNTQTVKTFAEEQKKKPKSSWRDR